MRLSQSAETPAFCAKFQSDSQSYEERNAKASFPQHSKFRNSGHTRSFEHDWTPHCIVQTRLIHQKTSHVGEGGCINSRAHELHFLNILSSTTHEQQSAWASFPLHSQFHNCSGHSIVWTWVNATLYRLDTSPKPEIENSWGGDLWTAECLGSISHPQFRNLGNTQSFEHDWTCHILSRVSTDFGKWNSGTFRNFSEGFPGDLSFLLKPWRKTSNGIYFFRSVLYFLSLIHISEPTRPY